MKEKTTFASRVQMLRKEKKLTQSQLGELLGIKGRTIRSYESDERRPDFDGLLQMARFFGVSLDYLVGWSEKRDISC